VRVDDNLGTMRADLTKVRQSLLNLLSNACKFTKQGAVTFDVARERLNGRDFVVFRVADTGIGISDEQMLKLFQPFSQADASTTRQFGGTGLGLVITRKFCELMGGGITVESERGKGSVFTIKLPAVVRDPRAPQPAEIEPAAESMPADASTVLIVDDDPAARELLQRTLNKAGFRVESAANAEDGLRLARALHPDAITLDVMMPGMDGWAALAVLKADPELADIPVIMLSIIDDKNKGYALGAADYMTKPIDREQLVSILNKYRHADAPCPALVVEDRLRLSGYVEKILEKGALDREELLREVHELVQACVRNRGAVKAIS